MRQRALITLLSLLAGCAWFDSLSGRDTLSVLRRNRDRWNGIGMTSYRFAYQLSCYCTTESTQPVTIVVEGGLVAQVLSRTDGSILQPSIGLNWPTIDSLFARAERNLAAGFHLSITYDGKYHFPGRVVGDLPGAIDDEYTLTAWITPD